MAVPDITRINTYLTRLTNKVNSLINVHNTDDNAHANLFNNKVSINQGSNNASKNIVTDSNGNITTEAKLMIDSNLSSSSTNSNCAGSKAVVDYVTTIIGDLDEWILEGNSGV